jgi:hypothetical protein
MRYAFRPRAAYQTARPGEVEGILGCPIRARADRVDAYVQASLSTDAVTFRGPVDTTGYIRYQVSLIVLPYCGFGCLSREMCHFVVATIGLQGGRDRTCRIY